VAYNTKNIIRDASGAPVPQFYNPTSDAYQPLTGVDLGGGRYGYDNLAWGKTAGGLYVPLKVANDGTVLTQLTGSYAKGGTDVPIAASRSGALAAGVSETVLDITQPVIVDDISLGANTFKAAVRIQRYDSGGVIRSYSVASVAGVGIATSFTSEEANRTGGSKKYGPFILTAYDTTDNYYGMSFDSSFYLICPFGLKVIVINNDTVEKNVALAINYRKMVV